MYRDDDAARVERASSLISEIGELERKKVEQVATDQRLEAARDELRTLQATATVATPKPPAEKTPSFGVHMFVFAATAGATYLGYTLFLAG
jgi:hypothetical protein